jgi:hypothetical protein
VYNNIFFVKIGNKNGYTNIKLKKLQKSKEDNIKTSVLVHEFIFQIISFF